MPMITVQMYAGRNDQQKADLVEALTVAFVESCGGNREGVWVIRRRGQGKLGGRWPIGFELAQALVTGQSLLA